MWSDYTERVVAKQGKRDGRGWYLSIVPWFYHITGPIPPVGSDATPPYFATLLNEGCAALEELSAAWERENGAFCTTAGRLVQDLRNWHDAANKDRLAGFRNDSPSEYVATREAREARWKELNRRAAKIVEEYKARCADYRVANVHARKNVDPDPNLSEPQLCEVPFSLTRFATLASALGLDGAQLVELGLPTGGDDPEPMSAPIAPAATIGPGSFAASSTGAGSSRPGAWPAGQ